MEVVSRAEALFRGFDARRSVRHFSDDPVPREAIEWAIRCASTAPSGAHLQPWRFVAIADPTRKKQLRHAVEEEERHTYEARMPEAWRQAIAPMGTTWEKPYLEVVPWVVIAFAEAHRVGEEGTRETNYYVKESVGLACGFFIAALHQMGLATLPHTPSPMGFLTTFCGRPPNERPFILFPVGFPTRDCRVPDITRKPLSEVAVFDEDLPPLAGL